ncbi:nitroreductase [bacterium]|nr:MAG: nitroreductase [bacterium]
MNANAIATQIQPADFPRFGPPEEQLRFLLRYAILAPSSHNTQPWLWQIEEDEVTLRADERRLMPALDSQGREMIISCGAALQHLCLAIRAFGYAALVQTFPDTDQPNLLARVRLASYRPPTADDSLLFRFITERHTHRGEFEERPLPTELLDILQSEAGQEGASLYFAQTPEDRGAITKLIENSDLIQNSDAAVRRDVADWIAPQGARKDGIPASALGISDLMSHLAPLSHRLFNRGELIAEADAILADNSTVLVVLCTPEGGSQAWLAAGQALGRVLLRARAEGVWASFFNQPVEVDEMWVRLYKIAGSHHFPQLVFRLGYAQPVPGTPRRPVEEVTNIHDDPLA